MLMIYNALCTLIRSTIQSASRPWLRHVVITQTHVTKGLSLDLFSAIWKRFLLYINALVGISLRPLR